MTQFSWAGVRVGIACAVSALSVLRCWGHGVEATRWTLRLGEADLSGVSADHAVSSGLTCTRTPKCCAGFDSIYAPRLPFVRIEDVPRPEMTPSAHKVIWLSYGYRWIQVDTGGRSVPPSFGRMNLVVQQCANRRDPTVGESGGEMHS